MSMRSLYSLALGLLTLLSIAGCKKSSEVVYEPTSDGVAYLRVDAAGVTFPVGGTRAQSEEPTINDDAEDFEDYVRELAVLVYEADGGEEKLIYSHFTTLPNFMLEIPAKQGQKYHFCFIANYPESWHNTLKGMQSYTELKTELQSLRDFKTLYQGVKAANRYLPMARIYESQELPAEKGSPVSPVPFIPKKEKPEALSPVSSATRFSPHETAPTYANTIMMVRSSAKVTVKTVGGDTPKIELVNVPEQHSYMESSTKPSSYTTLTMSEANTEQSSDNSLYVPESLLGKASTALGWNTTNDTAMGKVMYVQLTTKSGVVYRLPLFTDESGTASTDTMHDYLSYARNDVEDYTTNYSVLRNNHYIISVTLNDDSRAVKISYEVLPWVLMRSEYNFTNPKYTIEVTTPSGAKFADKNYLHLQEEATFKFNITEPKGGTWVASVTNAKFFTLVYGTKEQPVISGFVDGKDHVFKLKPLYPYNGFPQYTQVYITVNGQEIYLGGDDNRFVRDYTKHGRWKFAQVDSNL